MASRDVTQLYTAQPASDGAGVKLHRVIGGQQMGVLDPFLMLDEFNTENPGDYIAGFPAHPHRGFETVTYMLEGNMRHQDHMHNEGLLRSGDVQWMTAARGIIHSEMPEQVEGKMQGFQLWLNLPAAEKMADPEYHDIKAADIPVLENERIWLKLIAGRFYWENQWHEGAVVGKSTEPLYLDIQFKDQQPVDIHLPENHTALVFVYEGRLEVADQLVKRRQMAKLGQGDSVQLSALESNTRALVLAAKPIKEPVVQWGPFVMNTREEIEQAMQDYRDGRLTN